MSLTVEIVHETDVLHHLPFACVRHRLVVVARLDRIPVVLPKMAVVQVHARVCHSDDFILPLEILQSRLRDRSTPHTYEVLVKLEIRCRHVPTHSENQS